jgi:hypothetical protein
MSDVRPATKERIREHRLKRAWLASPSLDDEDL